MEKGFLEKLIDGSDDIQAVVHFQRQSGLLTVEDPQFVFYIRNIPWAGFARECGFLSVEFDRRYDFALSFSGSDRDIAEGLFERFQEEEVEVFYDRNEQHRLLAEDVEEYLAPIYQSESRFVVCVMGADYPSKIWTKFESDAFKTRLGNGEVIPVWVNTAPTNFDTARNIGAHFIDRAKPLPEQLDEFVTLAIRKLRVARQDDRRRPDL